MNKPVTSLTPPRALTYGTGYFPTFIDAVSYYRPYEGSNAIEAVVRKLNEGSIYIGKPVLKAGQEATASQPDLAAVHAAHDRLSELLEDSDSDGAELRNAAAMLCEALNGYYVEASQP